jgi:hypothetical protein
MYIDYEGYWYISRQCIMEILGDRITDVLHAMQQLKKELTTLVHDPSQVDTDALLTNFKNEIVLAFQIDAICQSSLEIRDDLISIYTIKNGQEVLRTGDIINSEYKSRTVDLSVIDREDGEENSFKCTASRLETVDQGVTLSFSREPTFFFSDLELDALDTLVRNRN